MINENIKPSNAFSLPYYAYAEKSPVSVATNSYVNRTLQFSSAISWKDIVITAEYQQPGAMVNISPVNGTSCYVTIVNHTSSAISGILRVRALLSVNVTMSIS